VFCVTRRDSAPTTAARTISQSRIAEAHLRGLMVFVLSTSVYNHFGPEGNYLGPIAQISYTSQTPGVQPSINTVVPQFVLAIENALYWLR